MLRPMQELGQATLDVQDASNLTAVAKSFATVLDDLWGHAAASGHGTDWVNMHPITKAFASKLTSLSGWKLGDGTFHEIISMACDAVSYDVHAVP